MITGKSRYNQKDAYETFDPARADKPINGLCPHRAGPLLVRCEHRLVSSERLDHLADRYYQEPLLYWLICDAADDIFPEALMIPGRVLRVPMNES